MEKIMIMIDFSRFLRDESGAYAVWSLVWFSLYVAMGGLAVDMTDAYRNQTLLQATADASSLAAVMSLPDQGDGTAQALDYASNNMDPAINGFVLDPNEVIFGNWDFATRTFTPGTTDPDAVRVVTRRDDSNNNPLAANFLRIMTLWGVPFDRFNISVDAIAHKYISDCVDKNGLIAGNKADVTSGNTFSQICIHADNNMTDPGQDLAIDLNSGNDFDPDTVQVSMPEKSDLNGRPNLCKKNNGLCEEEVLQFTGDSWVEAELEFLPDVIEALTGGPMGVVATVGDTGDINSDYVPSYITEPEIQYIDIGDGDEYTGTFEAGNMYRINCNDNTKPLSLPTDVQIVKVVIATNCSIKASNGLTIYDAVIASNAVGNAQGNQNPHYPYKAIDLASDGEIGTGDFCDSTAVNPGAGQVFLYSLASVQLAAKTTITGVEIRTMGDFQMAAQTEAYSISVIADHNIIGAANGSFSYCGGVFNSLIKNYQYALVK
jgi:hypothetical protein